MFVPVVGLSTGIPATPLPVRPVFQNSRTIVLPVLFTCRFRTDVPVPEGRAVTSPEDAWAAAEEIGRLSKQGFLDQGGPVIRLEGIDPPSPAVQPADDV